MNKVLEVCVDSVESAIAAERGGADRLELCANLVIGGTTPTIPFFKAVRKAVRIPLHVMIRPRYGDFFYTEEELQVMEEEIRAFSSLGAEGVVFGVLTEDADLDLTAMRRLKEAAGSMSCTLHRAFDVTRNPARALEDAVSLSMQTILTSGCRENCMLGISLLKELQGLSAGRIEIMAGAGLKPEHIDDLHKETGITAFHMSGKKRVDSPMRYRKQEVHMGLPGISEYERSVCDEAQIRKACEALSSLTPSAL
ncbi:MAG: copper homeostasis protein CutC [Lachnospiraceae bacterium]|nr:copper homeostasis protein CutC [Lachnospiraceae bacterium]